MRPLKELYKVVVYSELGLSTEWISSLLHALSDTLHVRSQSRVCGSCLSTAKLQVDKFAKSKSFVHSVLDRSTPPYCSSSEPFAKSVQCILVLLLSTCIHYVL